MQEPQSVVVKVTVFLILVFFNLNYAIDNFVVATRLLLRFQSRRDLSLFVFG